MSGEKSFASAVLYVHNDREVIGSFLSDLMDWLGSGFENHEIVIVDDCSTDGSMQCVREICAYRDEPRVTIVTMSFYHGLEFAMRAGSDLAIGDFVFEFDTLRYGFDANLMNGVFEKGMEGYDIVSAIPQGKRARSSKLFYSLFNKTARLNNDIDTESLRMLSRRAINRVASASRTIPYRKAAYANCGLPMTSVDFQPREETRGKADGDERRFRSNLAMDALILFTHTGYRVAVGFSILMMVFALLIAVYSVAAYLSIGTVEGWATTILFLSFGFFCLFAVLAFVIKYLQVIVDLLFKKKDYSFESIERL